MINLLEHYIWNSLPEYGDFPTNPNLTKKVGTEGNFLPFYGNTTVFLLNEEVKQQLQSLQEELYAKAGWMLSQKLDPATFHMTLHDLANAPEQNEDLTYRMADAAQKATALLRQWEGQPPLRMRTTCLFNMVSTSIVLGLAPADADSWNRLSAMYEAMEDVVRLGYAMTPHITMAYYRPGIYSQEALWLLRNALHAVDIELELRIEDLVYQTFTDMNHYMTE